MSAIMDFPEAWAFCRKSKMEDHDIACSYRVTNGGFLCDCHILSDEYTSRKVNFDLAGGRRERGGADVMHIKRVVVLMQVEVSGSDEDSGEKLDSFLSDTEENQDQPLYEGADALVSAMLKKGKQLGIAMKDKITPEHDFDINVSFRVVEKP